MGTKVQIMDMELDLFTQETFHDEIASYLANDVLNVVHMISLDYIDMYDENELVQEVMKEADMVLPGEKTILSAHHVEVLETGGMVVSYHNLLDLCQLLQDRTFYLVLRNEKEAKSVFRFMTRHFKNENVLGVYVAEGDVTEEALINDINMKITDVILLSMDSTEQEEWILNNKSKVNARICFVAGSIMPHIMRDNVHVPNAFEKMHLGWIYRRVAKIPNAHFFRKRIFNRKMDHYTTRNKLFGGGKDGKDKEEIQ